MGLSDDFMQFLKDYGVMGLAMAVVIGMAVTDLVNAVVEDVVMPIVGVLLPGEGWRTATYTIYEVEFAIGHLLGELLDFFIIALLLYVFIRYALKKESVEKL